MNSILLDASQEACGYRCIGGGLLRALKLYHSGGFLLCLCVEGNPDCQTLLWKKKDVYPSHYFAEHPRPAHSVFRSACLHVENPLWNEEIKLVNCLLGMDSAPSFPWLKRGNMTFRYYSAELMTRVKDNLQNAFTCISSWQFCKCLGIPYGKVSFWSGRSPGSRINEDGRNCTSSQNTRFFPRGLLCRWRFILFSLGEVYGPRRSSHEEASAYWLPWGQGGHLLDLGEWVLN